MLLHRTYTLWIFHNEFACRKNTAYNRSNVDENLKNLICTLKKICTKNDPQCMSIYVADTLQIYGIFPTDGKVKTCNKSRVYANFPLHKIHSVTITSKSTLRLLSDLCSAASLLLQGVVKYIKKHLRALTHYSFSLPFFCSVQEQKN